MQSKESSVGRQFHAPAVPLNTVSVSPSSTNTSVSKVEQLVSAKLEEKEWLQHANWQLEKELKTEMPLPCQYFMFTWKNSILAHEMLVYAQWMIKNGMNALSLAIINYLNPIPTLVMTLDASLCSCWAL